MRLARLLRCAPAGVGDLEPPHPIVALERDGAFYDVAALDQRFGTRFAPERFGPGACDFHARVLALGCAGLAELDERLLRGDRPTEARLPPGAFLLLAPCDTERAAYVQLDPYPADGAAAGGAAEEPGYRFGSARALLGHDAAVPFPASEESPDVELGLAAVLGEDLRRATAAAAAGAILGYTILAAWTARGLEAASPTRARDFGPQLGPVLVTADEIGDVAALRAQARIDGEVLVTAPVGGWRFHVAEALAFVSEHVDLRAGDVIGAGRVAGGSAAAQGRTLTYGAAVELRIERIGRLAGRPVRGPGPVAWRLARPT